MKFILALATILFALGQAPAIAAPGYPGDGGRNPWREVVCYAKDSQWNEYSARGFKKEERRVRERALRICRYHSERPSTCRITRCRP